MEYVKKVKDFTHRNISHQRNTKNSCKLRYGKSKKLKYNMKMIVWKCGGRCIEVSQDCSFERFYNVHSGSATIAVVRLKKSHI